jgi:hypothetical protein
MRYRGMDEWEEERLEAAPLSLVSLLTGAV